MASATVFRTRSSADGIEVSAEMVWAALEEWSGFDEARDELSGFAARLYRVMEAARRSPRAHRLPFDEIPAPRRVG